MMTDDTDDDPAPTTVTGAPERIWLCLGDLGKGQGEIPFTDLAGVTWCEDRQGDWDTEYVRADLKKGEARPKGGA